MTIPDKLVTAAAEVLCDCRLRGVPVQPGWSEHLDTCASRKVRAALAAAFAKLPECEEMRCPVSGIWHEQWVAGWNAALARMGEQ